MENGHDIYGLKGRKEGSFLRMLIMRMEMRACRAFMDMSHGGCRS